MLCVQYVHLFYTSFEHKFALGGCSGDSGGISLMLVVKTIDKSYHI
jgi:hypothetical protein